MATMIGGRPHFSFRDQNGDLYLVDRQQHRLTTFERAQQQPTDGAAFRAWQALPDLPRARILRMATALAKQHYPYFTRRGLQLTRLEQGQADWNVKFAEVLPENQAVTNNCVVVRLSRKDGTLWEFWSDYRPIPLAARRQPRVSRDQARQMFQEATGAEATYQTLTYIPRGELIWLLQFEGRFGGKERSWLVQIHADTGKLLSKEGGGPLVGR